MKDVFLTGGTGYIGQALMAAHHATTIVFRFTRPSFPSEPVRTNAWTRNPCSKR